MFTVRREMALRHNTVAPSIGEEPDEWYMVKRWSDIGGAPAVFAGRSLGPPL